MKLLWVLVGVFCLAMLIGGLGGVAEDTYPNIVPLDAPAGHVPVTDEGNPMLLFICIGAVAIGLFLGTRGH